MQKLRTLMCREDSGVDEADDTVSESWPAGSLKLKLTSLKLGDPVVRPDTAGSSWAADSQPEEASYSNRPQTAESTMSAIREHTEDTGDVESGVFRGIRDPTPDKVDEEGEVLVEDLGQVFHKPSIKLASAISSAKTAHGANADHAEYATLQTAPVESVNARGLKKMRSKVSFAADRFGPGSEIAAG